MDYNIIIFIFFGVLPSLTWLFYYLTKDLHPEPKKMIIKIFLWGCLITVPVFFIQIGLTFLLTGKIDPTDIPSPYTLHLDTTNPALYVLIYWFLVIALSEELFKYLVVRLKVVGSSDLDEPVDLMIYMVVAALGFAAVENILYLFTPSGQMSFDQLISRTLIIDFVRFIGATFLHTLCSATIGYSLAMSFCSAKKKLLIMLSGILLAMVLHGLYNFSIMTLDGYIRYIIPATVILTLAILVFLGFEKLKKMKGICKIN